MRPIYRHTQQREQFRGICLIVDMKEAYPDMRRILQNYFHAGRMAEQQIKQRDRLTVNLKELEVVSPSIP